MSRDTRRRLIEQLEQARGRRIIALVLGDRPGLETRIAPDLLSLVARQLRTIGRQRALDVFLYSTGGDVMAGYRLVSLFREYCENFSVLVPAKCQSTATLMALGANEIVMLAEGQLSPVDPSITGPYNPMIPGVAFQPGGPMPVLPVSVEDVVSYVQLARELGVQGEPGLVAIFERLTADVRPLALGQVFRARTQIRMLSRRLLEAHMSRDAADRVDDVVKTLTEKLYSHDYLISRAEARSIGLNVSSPENGTEMAIVNLFDEYSTDLMLTQPFSPLAALQGQPRQRLAIERAYVETSARTDAFVTERTLALAPNGQIIDQLHSEGWREV